jgi:histidinol-phosphate aminotransferase
MLATVSDIRAQRDRIVYELREMGLDPFRSDANFVLFGGLDDSAAVFEALLAKGVLIRNVGIPGTLRVTAGTEAETTMFLEALRETLGR